VLETRQRFAIWFSFAIGFALSALVQLPNREPPEAVGPEHVAAAAPALETTREVQDLQLGASIAAAAMRHGLDPALVLAVIGAESAHDPNAVSPKGAIGLMQILPETAALMGLPEPADPANSLEAGCRYLAALLDIFGGDVELALAAYNAGPGAVRRWGGVPPYRETTTFVRRVGANYRRITGLDVGTATRFTSDASAAF
jgi:soluble lytic murein transglycosylase-like protein